MDAVVGAGGGWAKKRACLCCDVYSRGTVRYVLPVPGFRDGFMVDGGRTKEAGRVGRRFRRGWGLGLGFL